MTEKPPEPEPPAEATQPAAASPSSDLGAEDGGPASPPTTPKVRESAKPLLASDALKDDLAPLEPGRASARIWCVVIGLAFLASSALERGNQGVTSALPSLALGGIALIAGLVPVAYRQRALAMAALGILAAALGLRGLGPAAGIAVGGAAWGSFRFLAATVLPAALLFRAHYRAYARARWLLGAAFLAALPFLGHAVNLLLVEELGLAHVGAAAGGIAVLASLVGFMGSETTGAGSYTALGLVVTLSAELALESLTSAGMRASLTEVAEILATTLSFAATAGLVALGLFQALAWHFAPDARRIDVHLATKRDKSDEQEREDWSTRG